MKCIAHIRLKDNEEQSVENHCRRTAKLAAQYAESVGLNKTAEIAGRFHDMGKFTKAFNEYIKGISNAKRGDIDHSFAGAKYLKEISSQSENGDLRKTVSLIGRVILSHHGLNDWIDDDSRDIYSLRIEKDMNYSEIVYNFQDTGLSNDIDSMLAEATCEIKALRTKLRNMAGDSKEQFAFYLGMLERFLQSVLIDADRTDTADFMSDSQTEITYDTDKLWKDMEERLNKKLSGFSYKNDEISKHRQSISNRCSDFAENKVGICRLIVPTGGGKTLSSLRFAIKNAQKYHKKKIIYIAPFMSILEQNSDEIRALAGEEAFLEHHSDMLSEVAEHKELLREYELRTEKWDSPVISTTMVQFLNSLFSGKSSAVRRMHRLSEAIIIIDEVQSIPLKCVYLFNLAMNFLSQICDSTIVLCSATQPPFEELKEFPLMLDKNDSMTGETDQDFESFRRTQLIYNDKKGGYSFDETAEFCLAKFKEQGSLLLVVNTKSSAKEMYKRLCSAEGAYIFHLSTNMCPQHRRECINDMKEKLSANKPVICVTTQLIEAGVDISFGCVVRSLAGMDNSAQAAGRCNRNGEHNSICPVYIIHLWEEKLGSLYEIKNAQSISREIFDAEENTDYLSVEVMGDYFRKLYRNEKNKLRYPLPETTDQDLINLLSLNRHRADSKKRPQLKFCGQAFRKAGRLFEVIDSNTSAVIVPYNDEADKLISALSSVKNSEEMVVLLRKAQKYSVNVYSGTHHQLAEESALYELQCGNSTECTVKILKKQFYDKEFGITTEGGLQEVLIL